MEAGGGAKQGGEAQTAACAVCDHLTPQHAGAGALLCTDLLPIYGSATLIIQNRQLFLRRCGCLAANAEHGGRNGEMWQVSQRLSWTCVVMRPNRPQLPIQKGTHKRNWLQFYAMVVCRVRTPYFCDPPKHAATPNPYGPRNFYPGHAVGRLWIFVWGRKSCAAPSSSRRDHGDRHPFKAERREHEPFSSCAQHICRLVRFICRRRAAVALGRQARRERVAVSRLLL